MVNLKIGDISWVYQEGIIPPKNKLSVCVHIDGDKYGFFLINSKAWKFYECTRAISSNKYTFLKHDSFISCSNLFSLPQNTSIKKIVGSLDREDLEAVLQRTETSRILTPRHKNSIVEQLKAALESEETQNIPRKANLRP